MGVYKKPQKEKHPHSASCAESVISITNALPNESPCLTEIHLYRLVFLS